MANDQHNGASFSTGDDSRFVNERRSNISSDLIEITEDKLENILLKHLEKLAASRGWLAPFGVFVSVLLALITASFEERFTLSSATWEAIFTIVAVASFIWLGLSLLRAFWVRKESTIEFLIQCIKSSDQVANTRSEKTLKATLVGRRYRLHFSPNDPNGWKVITFEQSGSIGENPNKNETGWRVRDGKLEILNSTGGVHSRFDYDADAKTFRHTNDPDTLSKRDQYIVLEGGS